MFAGPGAFWFVTTGFKKRGSTSSFSDANYYPKRKRLFLPDALAGILISFAIKGLRHAVLYPGHTPAVGP